MTSCHFQMPEIKPCPVSPRRVLAPDSILPPPPDGAPVRRARERTWWPCSVCPKKFDRPSLLKRHVRTHTGKWFTPAFTFFTCRVCRQLYVCCVPCSAFFLYIFFFLKKAARGKKEKKKKKGATVPPPPTPSPHTHN